MTDKECNDCKYYEKSKKDNYSSKCTRYSASIVLIPNCIVKEKK